MKLDNLDLRTRSEWRAWLAEHHAESAGVWLIFHKGHTGVPSIGYADSVCEALCFGWVDSLIKRLDDNRYARKFTPRKPTSKWSDSNRERWVKLRRKGLLAGPGLAVAPTSNRYGVPPQIPERPPAYIMQAFKANTAAWQFFQRLGVRDQRYFIAWIHLAKRLGTREKRIRASVKLLAAGKKLGLK